MKNLAFIALLATLTPLTAWSQNGDKIIGGTKSQGHDFFLQLSMDGTLNTAFCGSTAIAPGVAVTAAHCVAAKARKFKLIHGIDQDGVRKLTVLDVHAVISHQDYQGTFNDIALIFFDEEQGKNAVVPAPINRGNILLNDDTELRAIGRGNMTSVGTLYASELYEVKLPFIDNASCQAVAAYKGAVNNTHECAGEAEGGKDSCQGDSGGPLVAMINGKATLVGVTNFGLGCGQKGKPGVYASLRAHASWIDNNIRRYKYNETVASPNMDFAFASKCYLLDASEEVLQQQNTNDSGAMSLKSFYLPKTRFMKKNVALTATAKKICEFQVGQNKYNVMVETVGAKKLIIKNEANNETWLAQAKRKTDSIYQRCVQTAPMALSFDVAIGDGAAMVSINGNAARMSEIDPAQIPTDNSAAANCTINHYETIISTSQSAQAILVTLKNHVDEKTTVYVMGGNGSGQVRAPVAGVLSASLDVDTSSSARLTIDNAGDQDLYTWEIKCNKDFSPFNANRINSKTIRYSAGKDSKGTVLEGDSVEMVINFAAANPNADGKLKCAINRELGVQIK